MDTNVIEDGAETILALDDDQVWLLPAGSIMSHPGDFCFVNYARGTSLVVDGVFEALTTVNVKTGSAFIHVGETGQLVGTAIGIYVGNPPVHHIYANPVQVTILNDGLIHGGSHGMYLLEAYNSQIVNNGVLSGGVSGVEFVFGSNNQLVNHGLISGSEFGVRGAWNSHGLDVTNTGTIAVPDGGVAVQGYNPADKVVNSGLIDGAVHLGAGNDLFWSALGAVTGTVDAGAGNDRIVLGAGAEIAMGGTGRDTVKGGAGADTLQGGKGGDTLKGGKGVDTIHGGKGNDDLWGGKHADAFVFGKASGHDWIADFGTGADVIDLSTLEVDSWAALSAQIFSYGSDAVVELYAFGGDGTITLAGMAGLLSQDDFIF